MKALKLLVTLTVAMIATASLAQPTLIKDIGDESTLPFYVNALWNTSSGVKFKGRYYTIAQSKETGFEVYYTDGTAEGTDVLKEIVPGEKGIGTQVAFGGTEDYFIFGFEGEDGRQTWVSDGTAEGTVKIATGVNPYAADWPMFEVNGALLFTAIDAAHGVELWKTDGTAAGTSLVKDINGIPTGSVSSMVGADNQVFFVGADLVNGAELWRSDGTAAGTKMVKDIHEGYNATFYTSITTVGNMAYFMSGDDIWKSDGTEAGTTKIVSFPSEDFIFFEKMGLINNKLLFRHYSPDEGLERYVLDLATDQAQLLKETIVGNLPGVDFNSVGTPAIFKGAAWFFAEQRTGNRYGIWKTDGTAANTVKVFDFPDGDGLPGFMLATSNKLYIASGSSSYPENILATDGTSTPALVQAFSARPLTELNGKLLLNVNGEFYITEGAGTTMVKRINETKYPFQRTLLKTDNGFFLGQSEYGATQTFYDLWYSNGTTPGTKKLHSFDSYSSSIAVSGDKYIFHAWENGSQNLIWISDGTVAGTKNLKSTVWNTAGEFSARWVGNTAFMIANTNELWKSDGTDLGTVKVKTLPTNYGVSTHAAFKNLFYFFIFNHLWKSDGTDVGTVMVKEIIPGITYGVSSLVVGENKMYFSTRDADNGWEVWVSDGTTEGTHITKAVITNPEFYPDIRRVVNDVAYFTIIGANQERELWRSDGTEAGTHLVKDINEGPASSNPNMLVSSGNILYFTANDGVHGYELWKTDGTEEGTVMVKDIYPGLFSSNISDNCAAVVVDGTLYFSAIDETHGYELWKTDGTEEGTTLVYDLNPGQPSGIVNANGQMIYTAGRLIFQGDDGIHGREYFSYQPNKTGQTITFQPIGDKTTNDLPFQLTASSSSGLPITFQVVSGPATISGSTLTITGAGTVTVVATQVGSDEFSEASAEQLFNVILATGLEDLANNVTIYPNPATTNIVVNTPQSTFNSISLKDILGREIVSTAITSDETGLNVGDLPRGIYILRLNGANNRSITKKIILK